MIFCRRVVAKNQTTKKEIITNMKTIIKTFAALVLLSVFVFASERVNVFGASKVSKPQRGGSHCASHAATRTQEYK
jgi:hypothetical protein